MLTTTALHAYTTLISEASPAQSEQGPPPKLLPLARLLMQHAHELGTLPLQGAWRLHPNQGQALTEAAGGLTPPGGWQGLASLLSGTPVLKATHMGFIPMLEVDVMELWTEAELRRGLLEALSLRLIPPTTAAGLFLMMGLHPAWGLRVANETHKLIAQHDPHELIKLNTLDDEGLFPHPSHAVISHAIFASLSIILETLRSLEAGQRYRIEHLSSVMLEATRHARHLIKTRSPQAGKRALEPFIDHVTGHLNEAEARAHDFTRLDLLEHYLVPAGVVQCFEDQSFCVWPEAISGRLKLFGHGELGAQHHLTDMIARQGSRIAS